MLTKLGGAGWALAALLVVGASLGAADDKDKTGGDLKKLQGKWTAPSRGDKKNTYTFEGKKLKVVTPTRSYEMTVTIDPAAKPEKTIDFHIDEGPEDAKGKTSKGIYKFEGDDNLVWSYRPEGDRPDKYVQVEFEQILTRLTRAKD